MGGRALGADEQQELDPGAGKVLLALRADPRRIVKAGRTAWRRVCAAIRHEHNASWGCSALV